jgi:ubiquinone/menaquinone biosynthesis C-methylase UbiE
MKVNPDRDLKRLRSFYGAVASEQNRFILQWVEGIEVLDLGCGYGAFAHEASNAGKKVIGLDIDFEILKSGRSAYPSLSFKLIQGDMDRLPFKDKCFHAVILRESLHHTAWEKILPEILRVCKREILIFEPNPNWILRFCRTLISHQDQEVTLKSLLPLMEQHGLLIQGTYFRDLMAFPLSGGFVGRPFVPPIKKLYPILLKMDRMFHFFSRILGVEKTVCWRYLVKGILKGSEAPK